MGSSNPCLMIRIGVSVSRPLGWVCRYSWAVARALSFSRALASAPIHKNTCYGRDWLFVNVLIASIVYYIINTALSSPASKSQPHRELFSESSWLVILTAMCISHMYISRPELFIWTSTSWIQLLAKHPLLAVFKHLKYSTPKCSSFLNLSVSPFLVKGVYSFLRR